MEKKTVLVVDDSTDFRTCVCMGLQRQGFRCLEAANGLEGLTLLETHPEVSTVLTDLHMPIADGFWLLQHAKALGRNVRVVLMSCDASPGEVQRCGQLHDGFFRKPLDMTEVATALRQ